MNYLTKTVVIAHPESATIDDVRTLLNLKKGFRVVGESTDSAHTVRLVNSFVPDVLLIDASLYWADEGEIADQFCNSPLTVVLLGCGMNPIHVPKKPVFSYIRVPLSKTRGDRLFQQLALALFQQTPRWLERSAKFPTAVFAEDGVRFKKILVEEIRYIKAARDYSIIYTEGGEYVSSYGIGVIEQRLDPSIFLRVHRSFLVSLSYVVAIRKERGRLFLVLENNVEISVSRSYIYVIQMLLI